MDDQLDRSIERRALGTDHRPFAQLAPGLDALVDAVSNLDHEIVFEDSGSRTLA